MGKIKDISIEFAENVIAGIRRNIDTKNPTGDGAMNNTGEAKDSLGYRFEDGRLIIFSDMKGAKFNYIMTLETGRKPSEKKGGSGETLQDSIQTWLRQKGVIPDDGISQKSLAYLIARRIHREGSKLYRMGGNSGIISEYTNEKYINENLTKPLAEAVVNELLIEVSEFEEV